MNLQIINLMIYFIGMFMNTEAKGMYQGVVKGAKHCLNPYFFGWLEN